MSEASEPTEFLVLSRGQWRADKTPAEIQTAIDGFYVWYERLLAEGRARPGHRLMTAGKFVSAGRIVDGPFAEAKEIVGGYWFFVARDLDEAARLAAENPCVACGLTLEVRQLEPRRASAYETTNENMKL